MLKTKVGYSTLKDSYAKGKEAAKNANVGMHPILGMMYCSCNDDVLEVVNGAMSSMKGAPIIGCTSSGMIMTNDGIIESEDGFAGLMSFDDKNMNIGVAAHKAGKNAREIGRKVARQAVENAGENYSPNYFYMVASPKEEEDYLMGIQDVIGRVPMFGGSAADDTVEGNWKIFCNDEVFSDGVAVAFFYTDNDIVTSYTGAYRESENYGLITEVKNNRTLAKIDGVSALKKYAEWIGKKPSELKGQNLLVASITKPLGVKDPLGNLTVVRHPMFGDDMGTKTTTDDVINLGNKVVEKTAIVQLEATVDELIKSTKTTLKDVKSQLSAEPAGYFLVHCGGRKLGIGDRIDEVYKNLVEEAHGVPFIVVFTFGEYGYDEHSANICGGLMLSFTAFGEE
ncbi:MAG TPA: FIST C-terminal domain-containing protein [Candidatus Onthousia faecipullorum]|uniref:FIST C-terminal domain-containing protein n=1 Tax=Candidatus Onthousia faecipullorum TaxID=2840887 RepID=A0A9D1GDQ2_9FIRM|nr:FIST C-terminal domain-containing protein [Candidatus Onthousia faecipullorum]